MKIVVIDGQGGMLGKQLVESLRKAVPNVEITAVGTNSTATSNMLKALRDGVGVGGTLHFVIYRSGEYIDVAVQVLDANQLE